MTRQARSRTRRRPLEALELLIGSAGAFGLLAGFLQTFQTGPLGLFVLGVAVLSSLLHIVVTVRFGGSLVRALIEIVFWGGLSFGAIYGLFWYGTVYLAAHPDLLRFGGSGN